MSVIVVCPKIKIFYFFWVQREKKKKKDNNNKVIRFGRFINYIFKWILEC